MVEKLAKRNGEACGVIFSERLFRGVHDCSDLLRSELARAINSQNHAARPLDASANARIDFIGISQLVLLSFRCVSKPLRTRRRISQVEIDNNSAACAVVTSNGSGEGTAGFATAVGFFALLTRRS